MNNESCETNLYNKLSCPLNPCYPNNNCLIPYYPPITPCNPPTITVGTTTTGKPGTEAIVTNSGNEHHAILDFTIPRGEQGTQNIPSVYIVSLSDNYPEGGLEIESSQRLPLERKEIDTQNISVLDTTNNTIQFNKTGYYKIHFSINAYTPLQGEGFNQSTNFIAVGFRKIDDETICAGNSVWTYNGNSTVLNGQGIFLVNTIEEKFELVNLAKRSLFLKTPDISNILTTSFLINAPITIAIEYLG